MLVPILPTRNMVVYPGRTLPLAVGRKRSVAAVERAQEAGGFLLTVAQRVDTEMREPAIEELYRVGTLCRIERARPTGDGALQVVVRGVARVSLREVRDVTAHLGAFTDDLDDIIDADERTMEALRKSVKELAIEILQLVPGDTRQVVELVEGIEDLSLLVHLCAEHLDAPLEKKQELLEAQSLKRRALLLLELMLDDQLLEIPVLLLFEHRLSFR